MLRAELEARSYVILVANEDKYMFRGNRSAGDSRTSFIIMLRAELEARSYVILVGNEDKYMCRGNRSAGE